MRIALFGGTSDIGLAIVEELAGTEPTEIILLMRNSSPNVEPARERLLTRGYSVVSLDFDALAFDSHPGIVDRVFEKSVDVAIVAFGVLGDSERLWQDHAKGVETLQVNSTGTISVGIALGQAFTRQGGGQLVLVSSMAGEKVRQGNFVYGLSKQAADEFYTHLGDAIPELEVLVVRPGFVRTKMTEGRQAALAVTAEQVAKATVRALGQGRDLVRVPWVFGPLVFVYRHLPAAIRNRLNF